MTITRIWQAGAESDGTGSLAEFHTYSGVNIAVTSAVAKSGSYCFRFSFTQTNGSVLMPDSGTYQLRTGLHVKNMALLFPSSPATILSFRTASANLVSLRVKNPSELQLLVVSTERAVCTYPTPFTVWKHLGLDIKIDASAGWAVLYIDGREVMRFEGNTGSSPCTLVRYGHASSLEAWSDEYGHCDNLFIDDTTGEAAAAVVPDVRFEAQTANGNGTYADGVGSDGNSVDNYALVDERPHTSDTDYVILSAADEQESYAMSNVTLPAGATVAALIPFVYALKTDAGVATQLAPLLRLSGTDVEGTAQDLPSSYNWLWERFTTKPGGGAWDQTGIDAVEVGYQGEGTF